VLPAPVIPGRKSGGAIGSRLAPRRCLVGQLPQEEKPRGLPELLLDSAAKGSDPLRSLLCVTLAILWRVTTPVVALSGPLGAATGFNLDDDLRSRDHRGPWPALHRQPSSSGLPARRCRCLVRPSHCFIADSGEPFGPETGNPLYLMWGSFLERIRFCDA